MPEIRFYHMTRTTLETALPRMLEKTLERKQRAVVRASSPERVEALNNWLWTYHDRSFLPHGSAQDGHAEAQPVWLTPEADRPNGAEVLFLTDGADTQGLEDYALCAMLFDGNDETALAAARAQWRALQDRGFELTYWQQDEGGRWQEKT